MIVFSHTKFGLVQVQESDVKIGGAESAPPSLSEFLKPGPVRVKLKQCCKWHVVRYYLLYCKRPNISRNTSWNCNLYLPFKNLPRKLHAIQTPLQKLRRNSLY